jgi:type I restriction-modification system DNA methylase subunit
MMLLKTVERVIKPTLNHEKLTLEQLTPFQSINDVKKVAMRLANEIFAKHGHDRLQLFDSILTLLLVKIYDEENNPKNLQFAPNSKMYFDLSLFKKTVLKASKYFGINDWTINFDIDGPTFQKCIEIFNSYSITKTITLQSSTEIIGNFYQEIVSSTFRGSLGAYFTPKPLCKFALNLSEVNDTKNIFDISCGSGTFLITAFEHIKSNNNFQAKIFGVDIQKRMVLSSTINALFHGIKNPSIIHSNGLKIDLKKWNKENKNVPKNGFSLIVGNPPFAGFETENNSSKKTHNKTHKIIPFIKKVGNLLQKDGLAILVVPTSVLNAESNPFTELRNWILQNTLIEGIISVSKDTILHTDTGIEIALLIFRKKSKSSTNPKFVYVNELNEIGYDKQGRNAEKSETQEIINDFKKRDFTSKHWIEYDFFMKQERWDPLWIFSLSKPMTKNKNFIPLTDLVDVEKRTIERKNIDSESTIKYFEVNDTNVDSGAIDRNHIIKIIDLKRKNRLKYLVKTGDILLPNHRDSLLAKKTKGYGRGVILVDEEHDGNITTDRFIVLKPKINPYLASIILNSKFIRQQLVIESRGSASYDIRSKVLNNVFVPKIWTSKKSSTSFISMMIKKKNLEQELISIQDKISNSLEFNL